jgi:type I restriction enzyme S subunit
MRGKAARPSAGPVEGPWDLPEGWRWERLGDLGTWFGGGTPSKAVADYWADGEIPWISPKDMKRFELNDTEDHITEGALASSAARLVPADSVVCVMRSGILKHSFPVALIGRPMALNQDLRAVHPRPGIHARFLAHFLRSAAQSILHHCFKDGTTVDSVDAGRLSQVAVPIPPPDVQQRIVARIDALFAEIDEGEAALRRARAGVETYRKALLKAAVTGELTADWRRANPPQETGEDLLQRILADRRARWHADPRNARKTYKEPTGPDTENLPDLPEGWVWASLEQLTIQIRNGLSTKPTEQSGGVPILRISAVRPMEIISNQVRLLPAETDVSEFQVAQGDLLTTRYSGSPQFVGVVAKFRSVDPIAYPDKLIRLRMWTADHDMTDFIEIAANFGQSRRAIEANIKTTAGQHGIAGGSLSLTPIPVPPKAETMEIMARTKAALYAPPADLGIHRLEATSATLRQSILAAAFRGELVA